MEAEVAKERNEKDEFNWKFPVYAFFLVVIVFSVLTYLNRDLGIILFVLLVALSVFLLLVAVVFARGKKRLSIATATIVCSAVSFILVKKYFVIRSTVRWVADSRIYKDRVLSLSTPVNGELKHAKWDGWGFAGAGNTTVYLVFDPTDTLENEANTHLSGKFTGIPCEAYRVHRFEKQWYYVWFYTDTDWTHCA